MQTITIILIFLLIPINGKIFFDINELDWSIRPTDDFFTFVNGHWINRTIIPPSQTNWGAVYTMSYEILFKLKDILDVLTRNGTSIPPHPVDSIERKLTDFFRKVSKPLKRR